MTEKNQDRLVYWIWAAVFAFLFTCGGALLGQWHERTEHRNQIFYPFTLTEPQICDVRRYYDWPDENACGQCPGTDGWTYMEFGGPLDAEIDSLLEKRRASRNVTGLPQRAPTRDGEG